MNKAELRSIELFYTAPKDEYFEELKKVCIVFWENILSFQKENYDVKYTQEKIERIKDLSNEGPNFASMVQMIHQNYRIAIAKVLSCETRHEISIRLYGYENSEFDPFSVLKFQNY